MSILTANLRLLCQRRALWLVLPVVLLLFWGLTQGTPEEGGHAVSLLAAALCGCILGTYQRETRSCPFSFLLPRHGWLVPRQSLALSGVCGVFVAWCWAGGEAPLLQQLGLLAATWLLGTASCMAGTVLGFTPASGMWLIPLISAGTLLSRPLPMAALAFSLFVGSHHVAVAAGALVVIAWSWRRLGRRDLARFWCGVPSLLHKRMMAQDQWRRSGAGIEDEPELGSRGLACRCVAGMRRNRLDSVWRRYCYAAFYEWFGQVAPRQVLYGLGFAMALVLWFAYMQAGAVFGFIPVIVALSLREVHANTFVSIGRQQRSILAVAGMLMLTALATGLVGLLIIASQIAAPAMPAWTLGGTTMAFHPLPYACALVPAATMPLAMAVLVWLGKRRSLFKLAVLVPPIVLLPAVVLLTSEGGPGALIFWLALILVAMLASVRILRHHCRRRDLV